MTTEPEAIPADVRALARRLADENELSLFNEDLIVHAIIADRASRAPVDGAGWRPIETAPKDGTHILAKLHRAACDDMDDRRQPAFTEIREIFYRPYTQFGMDLPWHAGDPMDSHEGLAPDHMGEAVPIAWMPLPAAPGTVPAPVDGAEAKPGWLPPETAPKDGTMLRLLIRVGTGENDGWTPFSDSSAPYETIGFNALADTLEDEWQFAGWDWCHDCFTDGAGEVIGWLPFGPHPAPSSPKCSQCDFGLGGHEPSCPNAPASPDAEMVERLTALTNSLRAAASRGPVTSREIFNLTDPIMDTLSKHEGPRS